MQNWLNLPSMNITFINVSKNYISLIIIKLHRSRKRCVYMQIIKAALQRVKKLIKKLTNINICILLFIINLYHPQNS